MTPTPCAIPGAEMNPVGGRCSFDAFIDKYKLGGDAALLQLARVVRGADTSRLDLSPQSAGLCAISLGLSRVFADDHAMLARGPSPVTFDNDVLGQPPAGWVCGATGMGTTEVVGRARCRQWAPRLEAGRPGRIPVVRERRSRAGRSRRDHQRILTQRSSIRSFGHITTDTFFLAAQLRWRRYSGM